MISFKKSIFDTRPNGCQLKYQRLQRLRMKTDGNGESDDSHRADYLLWSNSSSLKMPLIAILSINCHTPFFSDLRRQREHTISTIIAMWASRRTNHLFDMLKNGQKTGTPKKPKEHTSLLYFVSVCVFQVMYQESRNSRLTSGAPFVALWLPPE